MKIQCPQCGEEYEVPEEWDGRNAQCEACSTRFRISLKPEKKPGLTLVDDPPPPPPPPAPTPVPVPAPIPAPVPSGSKIVISFDDVAIPAAPIPAASVPSAPMPAARNLSPRQRRLMADSQMMHQRFSTFPYIHLVEAVGNPPEKYIVDYFVKGIERLEGERPVFRSSHRVEIKLPGTYPRTQPLCRMLTPIFHPNIEPAVICIGDHWSAGERLCDLVIRIGEIITYQSYNIKSPLDGEAAMWADLHGDMLPIDNCDLFPPEN